jgi:hypothetical protein
VVQEEAGGWRRQGQMVPLVAAGGRETSAWRDTASDKRSHQEEVSEPGATETSASVWMMEWVSVCRRKAVLTPNMARPRG